MSNEELKEVYFGFYHQLLEPYCSAAKREFDISRTCGLENPSVADAIMTGIVWGDGEVNWKSVYNSLLDGETTYLKPAVTKQKEATDEQILSYLVYMVVESMGEQSLTRKEILERSEKLKELLA